MQSNEQNINRRKHPRFSLKNSIFVTGLKIGRLVDISHGGMAFHYADHQEWPEELSEKSTLQYNNEDLLQDIAIKTVSDTELPNSFKNGSIIVRRRSVCFQQLTPEHVDQLNKLIDIATPLRQTNTASNPL